MPAFDERSNGNLRQRNDLGLHPEFVNPVYNHDEWQIEVSRDKGFSLPMAVHESRESSSKEEKDKNDQRNPSDVRLEGSCPRELLMAIDSLHFAPVVESEISYADTDPVHQCGD